MKIVMLEVQYINYKSFSAIMNPTDENLWETTKTHIAVTAEIRNL
jgi:hypothetical protein